MSGCAQYEPDGKILITEQADWWVVARYYVSDSLQEEAIRQCDGDASLYGDLSCERVDTDSGVAIKCASEYRCVKTIPRISQLGGGLPLFIDFLFFLLFSVPLGAQIAKRAVSLKSGVKTATIGLLVAEAFALLLGIFIFWLVAGSVSFLLLGYFLVLLPFLHLKWLHSLPLIGALFEKSSEYVAFIRERQEDAGKFYSTSQSFNEEEYHYIAGFVHAMQILFTATLGFLFLCKGISAYMDNWQWFYVVLLLVCSGLVSWFFYWVTSVLFDTLIVSVMWLVYGSLFRLATVTGSDQGLQVPLLFFMPKTDSEEPATPITEPTPAIPQPESPAAENQSDVPPPSPQDEGKPESPIDIAKDKS